MSETKKYIERPVPAPAPAIIEARIVPAGETITVNEGPDQTILSGGDYLIVDGLGNHIEGMDKARFEAKYEEAPAGTADGSPPVVETVPGA